MPGFQTPNPPNFWPNQAPLYQMGMNPYSPGPFGQVQPPMQQMPMGQPQNHSGRPVTSVDEIQPNEVPMDGTLTLFPKKDGSCIYAKAWDTDGTIKTLVYNLEVAAETVEETEPAPLPVTLDDLNAFAAKVSDAIDERIDKRLTSFEEQMKPDTAYQDAFNQRLDKIEELINSIKKPNESILLK